MTYYDSSTHLPDGPDAHHPDHDLLGFLDQCAQVRQRMAF